MSEGLVGEKFALRWPLADDIPLRHANQFAILDDTQDHILIFGDFLQPIIAHYSPQDVRDFMGKATIKPVAKILLSRDGLLAFYALLTGYMKDKKLIE